MKKLFTLALMLLSGLLAKGQNDMESWRNFTVAGVNLEAPNGWFGFDSLVIWKEDDSLGIVLTGQQLFKESATIHGGTYSARIETTEIPGLFVIPGIMSNAQPQFGSGGFDVDDPIGSIDFVGGTPITERIEYVNAWIRYISLDVNEEEAGVFGAAVYLAGQGVNGTDSLVGSGDLPIAGNTAFENMSVHINYINSTVVPDLIKINFISSADLSNAFPGTAMYVDDVTMSTTSVKTTVANKYNVKCYPNPTAGMIYVNSTMNEPMNMQVFSLTGQVVASQKFNGRMQADLSHLTNGMYFYHISNASGEVVKQDKIIIHK